MPLGGISVVEEKMIMPRSGISLEEEEEKN